MNREKLYVSAILVYTMMLTGCGGASEPSGAPAGGMTFTTLTPPDDATNVDAQADLVMGFDRFIAEVPGKRFKIFKSSDDIEHTNFDVSAVQVNVNGDKVTVNPNNHLVYGAAHYVKIDAGAFKDASGNTYGGISDITTWNFSVPSGSGPCGMDCVDNCDLPANLQ